jgi:putative transposase
MTFPRQHRTKLHSTNPIERLNKEIKRRSDVVGVFPNEASIMRLIGAVLFEANDNWQTSSRYMMVEAFARLCCTNRMRDSSRESSVIAGPHEQTYTPDL